MRSWRLPAAGGLVLAFAYASLTSSTLTAVARSAEPCVVTDTTRVRVVARTANTVTHVAPLKVAPGESEESTDLDEPRTTLRSEVVSGTRVLEGAAAQQVLDAVEQEQRVQLAGPGEVSRRDGLLVRHAGVGDEEEESFYSVYAGYRTWQGTYVVESACAGRDRAAPDAWQVTTEGTWSSFEPALQTGTALCTLGLRQFRSSYVKGSLPFRACSRSWW